MKVLYGSANGFHAVDLDSASVYDIYLPKHSQGPIQPHTIVTLPNSNGMQLLLCYDNEGVYVNTYGKVSKNIVLQVLPTTHARLNHILFRWPRLWSFLIVYYSSNFFCHLD